MVTTLKLWWHPPPVDHGVPSRPTLENYTCKRLLLWMPRKMWRVDFSCPRCKVSLHSKGPYNRVRLVLDVKDMYYLAGEYMSCSKCSGAFVSWDHRMLSQLADGVRARFPVVLTYKYACDQAIVSLLRARTIGNSPTALCNNLQELHSDEWLRKQLCYLTDCQRYRSGLQKMGISAPQYLPAAPVPRFPTPKWFLAVYVRDVWSRLPSLLAQVTSTFGAVLKVDSTKKVVKKLQGAAADTANWATSVGNERGEIVMSVLTTSESAPSLKPLADGLVQRYRNAGVLPPKVIYTDRDCCSDFGPSKYGVLFEDWGELHVRLDIWHFMRRLAGGVTSESHPLYGTLMSRLSMAIFEWDMGDYPSLLEAKKGELEASGISNPSEKAARKAITREELLKHCRRRTRGAEETIKIIEHLLLSLSSATDTLGVPLLKEEVRSIWAEQKKHVPCIQDPPGISLYTVVGYLVKGGVRLQVLRCARGSTSLESFHLHLARFIPGSSASAVNFQAFLLDGISRWNASRGLAAIDAPRETTRTFNVRLQERVNSLSQCLHGREMLPLYQLPSKYTGEIFGVEYLFRQSGIVLNTRGEELDKQIDEGFEDIDDHEDLVYTAPPDTEDNNTAACLLESDSGEDETEVRIAKQHLQLCYLFSYLQEESSASLQEDEVAADASGIPGWDRVDDLAKALMELDGLAVNTSQAQEIEHLYNRLVDYDKRPIFFRPRRQTPSRGRFARKKQSGHMSVEAMKRLISIIYFSSSF